MKSHASALILLFATACGQGDAVAAAQRAKPAPRIEVPPLDTDAPAPAPTPAPASSTPVLPPEAGTPSGPSGTAGNGTPTAYDAVGYASWYGDELAGAKTAAGVEFDPKSISIAHRTLPLGSVVEVTSLDTGKTILALVGDRGPGRTERELDLSLGAAKLLGMNGRSMAPVRVRAVVASPADQAALRAGQAASPRLDTPEPVLRALRKQLPKVAGISAQPVKPAPAPSPAASPARAPGASYAAPGAHPAARPSAPATAPASTAPVSTAATSSARSSTTPAAIPTKLVVQVGSFSSESRARNLARTLHGFVETSGNLWRVKTGPYGDMASAQRARDAAVSRGYADAAILVAP